MNKLEQPCAETGAAVSGWRPRFGDVVENGWASEGNPTRRGYFVRSFTRKGRLNPGLTWEITDGEGKFWELQPRVIGDRLALSPPPPSSHDGLRIGEGSSVAESGGTTPVPASKSDSQHSTGKEDQ